MKERDLLRSNDQVYSSFPSDHPARMYLLEFFRVRDEVCGRDIAWAERPSIEQEWDSSLLQRPFSFSAFAYCFVSYTLVMEEWFDDRFSEVPSDSEKEYIRQLQMKLALLQECANAARSDDNDEILRFVEMVRSLLVMGTEAIAHRIGMTRDALVAECGMEPRAAAESWLASNTPHENSKGAGGPRQARGQEPPHK